MWTSINLPATHFHRLPFSSSAYATSFGTCGGMNSLFITTPILKFPTHFPNSEFLTSPTKFGHSGRVAKGSIVQMTLADQGLAHGTDVIRPADILAYDLIQGANVRWSYIMDKSVPHPPTAILVHGILGCRKNWGSFARRLAQEFPKWQFLLVDLRCHGDSAAINKRGPHNVHSAALDVLKLLGKLKITPRVVVGHSFGGKVALSMVDQAAKPLARPVRVWVLDASPGKVRAGGDGEDHPAELISFLSTLPKEIFNEVVELELKRNYSIKLMQN